MSDPEQNDEGEPVINPERLEQIDQQADDEEEAEAMKAGAMLEQQRQAEQERGGPQQDEVDPALADNQIYEEEIDYEDLLEDVDEETRDKWMDQLVLEGEIVHQEEIADGRITATFKVRSGDDSLDLAEVPREVQDEDPEATIQYINTKMSLRRLALVTMKVNDESIGSTPDEREQWFRDRPGPFANRLLEAYNDLEMKISAVLRAGDIKN